MVEYGMLVSDSDRAWCPWWALWPFRLSVMGCWVPCGADKGSGRDGGKVWPSFSSETGSLAEAVVEGLRSWVGDGARFREAV